MVGAGVLVQPLLGLPHYAGVIIVGAIVITIVATAGMASTTYVQFLKGSLLIVFSLVAVIAVLTRGLTTTPNQGGDVPFHPPQRLRLRRLMAAWSPRIWPIPIWKLSKFARPPSLNSPWRAWPPDGSKR